MTTTTIFKTNPVYLSELLIYCQRGELQLPDFQRSWVWDDDRIKSLIASISRAFPVGALMTLVCGGEVNFKPRLIEGVPKPVVDIVPESLLLDGQQRVTSLYQAILMGKVVETITPKKKKVKRWFYIDIRKSLDPSADREEAIVSVPEERTIRTDFGREIVFDVSTAEKEYATLMFPMSKVLEWDDWQDGFNNYWSGDVNKGVRDEFLSFKKQVLQNFKLYQIPVISLVKTTPKEAVCVVFEKVNTGGKALDAFELVTAMYAADGHRLRVDWYGDDNKKGRHQRLAEEQRFGSSDKGILANVSNTDFLQAISLFYTRDLRRAAAADGKEGKELPAVTSNRNALLNLPLEAYLKYETQVEQGFVKAAKFLHELHIYRIFDLPYQSQIIPLAAILADIGNAWEHATNRDKMIQWYWNGVFGELYGSAVDSRISRDFVEVPAWLKGGPEPSTITDTMFRPDRLKTMRMRLSAAYKGVNVLLMKHGAQDFRSGQKFDHTVFFGDNVDIHHIFPKNWCKKDTNKIPPAVYDSIINKTPLSDRTNRIIGGDAPSEYIAKLEKGDSKNPPIAPERIDGFLKSHLIDPALLREDRFEEFMADRQKRLLSLIAQATGKTAYIGDYYEEGEELEVDDDVIEAKLTIS